MHLDSLLFSVAFAGLAVTCLLYVLFRYQFNLFMPARSATALLNKLLVDMRHANLKCCVQNTA